MKLHKRPSNINQQASTAVRPPLPRDASKNGINSSPSGMVPPGFVSVWRFDGNQNTKDSDTTKPGRKVY